MRKLSPVFGFRPGRAALSRNRKLPKPESRTPLPAINAAASSLKKLLEEFQRFAFVQPQFRDQAGRQLSFGQCLRRISQVRLT